MARISRALSLLVMMAFMAGSVALAGGGKGGGTLKGKITYKKPKAVKNNVVYLEKVGGTFKPSEAQVDQKGSTFIPRILPVVKGAKVTFMNSDPTTHNVYTPDGETYDLGNWDKGEARSYTFNQLGVYTQLCKLHPTMIAYIVVLQNPYYGISDKEGNFSIENIPPGKYKVLTWNERYGAQPVEIDIKEGGTAEIAITLKKQRRKR